MGLVTGAFVVGVVPVVGLTVGLGFAGIGVGVVPLVVFGVPVGFVAGTAVVVDIPAVGVVFVPVAGLLFRFCAFEFPALNVALTATPLSSVVTAIGSGLFNKPAQFS